MILNKEDSYEIAIMNSRIYYALAEGKGWAWQDADLSVSRSVEPCRIVHSSTTSSVTVYLNGGTDAGQEFTSTTWPGAMPYPQATHLLVVVTMSNYRRNRCTDFKGENSDRDFRPIQRRSQRFLRIDR